MKLLMRNRRNSKLAVLDKTILEQLKEVDE